MVDTRSFIITIVTIWGIGFVLLPLAVLFHLPSLWRERLSTVSLWLALLGSVIGMVVSWVVWQNGPVPVTPFTISLNLWEGIGQGLVGVPKLQTTFHLDQLSAFFTFLVSSFSAMIAVYSFDALTAPHYRRYRSQIISAFNLFILATVLVIVAYDVFSLILTLEVMTLAFGYLVLYKHMLYLDEEETHPANTEKRKNARIAPQVYMAISHTSTAFLLVALLILALQAGNMNFTDLIKNRLPASEISTVVFLLALAGLGIRAGLVPAHIWVSLVHPSSPTTTHALSLGIAIKVAIYLMYRFFFQFLEPRMWWGQLLLLIAVGTALVNVWYAISSHDLKTALAYHSIENIGIICAGIGVAMIFWKTNTVITTLGLIASLYHLLNHAVFKGLLYLATGAIDNLTHQIVEFDQLGGLIKRYQFTSTMFLIGSFAIAGFPPFNGFISEWLMLQALFRVLGVQTAFPYWELIITLTSLVLLVASFALTAFCFYKIAGIALLGLPRLAENERKDWESRDVPLRMKSVMGLMAILCLVLGLLPGFVIPLLGSALTPLGIQQTNLPSGIVDLSLNADAQPSHLPILAIVTVVIALVIILFLVNLRRPVKPVVAAWNCGVPLTQPPIIQFTSGAASFLLRAQFVSPQLHQRLQSLPDYLPARLVVSYSKKYPQQVFEVFRVMYNLVIYAAINISEWFAKRIQNRDIRRYLWYIFFANLIALITFILYSLFSVPGSK